MKFFGAYKNSTLAAKMEAFSLFVLNKGTKNCAMDEDTVWFVFQIEADDVCNAEGGEPYIMFVAQEVYVTNVSYDDLAEADLEKGVSLGKDMSTRLITGTCTNTSEWDICMPVIGDSDWVDPEVWAKLDKLIDAQ